MRRLPLVLVLSCLESVAAANGRFPATGAITSQPNDPNRMIAETTFGALLSTDGGATWHWTCEANVGYVGVFDPVYAFTPHGTIVATTPSGLGISRNDGCDFVPAPAPIGSQWIGDVTVGPDGAIWAATATGGMANDVYVSRDDGVTFQSTNLPFAAGWWKSVRVAKTDARRVYVTGYQLVGPTPSPLLYRSDDGGATWTGLPFDFMGQSQLKILAVSPTDEDVVFARIDTATDDFLLRSENGGQSWTQVATFADNISAFVVRADGLRVIAGSVNAGEQISNDGGVTFTPVVAPRPNPPKMACLHERSDGLLFACAANWNPDNMAVAESTDGTSWSKRLRFVEIQNELACPAGSRHADVCSPLWCGVATQFGIDCASATTIDGGPVAAQPDAGRVEETPHTGGTCGCGVSLGLVFVAPLGVSRRRRRASSR